MKYPASPLLLPLLLALAMPAQGGSFSGFLATLEPGSFTGTQEDFMAHVTWIADPAPRQYECSESSNQAARLDIWQGAASGARDKFGQQHLIYGENGSVRVFAMADDKGKPRAAAYFMLPSGETHLFRMDFSSRGLVKSGKRFDCREQDPPET